MVKELDIKKVMKEVLAEADKKSQKRFDGMMEDINNSFKKVEDGFKAVFTKFDHMNDRFDRIDETLVSHTNIIGASMMDITEVKSDIKSIKWDVKTKIESKADVKHFIDLEIRMRKLEKK